MWRWVSVHAYTDWWYTDWWYTARWYIDLIMINVHTSIVIGTCIHRLHDDTQPDDTWIHRLHDDTEIIINKYLHRLMIYEHSMHTWIQKVMIHVHSICTCICRPMICVWILCTITVTFLSKVFFYCSFNVFYVSDDIEILWHFPEDERFDIIWSLLGKINHSCLHHITNDIQRTYCSLWSCLIVLYYNNVWYFTQHSWLRIIWIKTS